MTSNVGRNNIFVSSTIVRASAICIGDENFGSSLSRSELNGYVIASFLDDNDNISYYPGKIIYYFKHRLSLPENNIPKTVDHYLCLIDWYRPSKYRAHFYVPCRENIPTDNIDFRKLYHTELWGAKYSKRTCENILPVQRLVCRFVKGKYRIRGARDELNVVIPLNNKISL